MYMQNDITASTANNADDKPVIDTTTRKAIFESVIRIANDHRDGLDRLSEFSVASLRHDVEYASYPAIRAIPVSGFGGCEFRFAMPSYVSGIIDVADAANQIVEAAHLFLGLEDTIVDIATLQQQNLMKAIERTSTGIKPMRVTAIGFSTDPVTNTPRHAVDVEMLGHDLTMRTVQVYDDTLERVGAEVQKLVVAHLNRQRLATQAIAASAIGWIDEAALRVLDASGLPRLETIEGLRQTFFTRFKFDGPEGREVEASLHWEDGVIVAYANRQRKWHLEPSRTVLEIPLIPSSIRRSLKGRRLSEVIDHPFVPGSAVITKARIAGGFAYIDLAIPTVPIVDQGGVLSVGDQLV